MVEDKVGKAVGSQTSYRVLQALLSALNFILCEIERSNWRTLIRIVTSLTSVLKVSP